MMAVYLIKYEQRVSVVIHEFNHDPSDDRSSNSRCAFADIRRATNENK
jgi:hypothetical protein